MIFEKLLEVRKQFVLTRSSLVGPLLVGPSSYAAADASTKQHLIARVFAQTQDFAKRALRDDGRACTTSWPKMKRPGPICRSPPSEVVAIRVTTGKTSALRSIGL